MRHLWSTVTTVTLLGMMLFLAACGGSTTGNNSSSSSSGGATGGLSASKKYNVVFYEAFGSGASKTALQTLTKQYEQMHPNVTVQLDPYDSYTTLKTKITAAIAAGKPPAIAQVYEEWATQYQQANDLLSLQPFIAGKDGLSQSNLSDFYPSLLKDGQINGTQYMLPFNKSDIVLYYNSTELQKLGLSVPTTWQDLMTDLTKATKANGSQWGLSITPDVDTWSVLYKDLGGTDFISSDGKTADFGTGSNAQIAQQALEQFAPLVKSGVIHVTKSYNWQNDFASGKSLFAIATVASYPYIKQGVNGTFQFSEAPLPGGTAGQYTVMYGTNLALFSGVDSDTQAAAWDYMKFLTSASSNATFVQDTGYLPTRQSVFTSSALQSYYNSTPALKAGPQSLPNGFVASNVPAWDQCRDIITTAFTSTLTSQSSAAAALSKMTQSCNSALAQG